MSPRLYLDEDTIPELASLLRDRGYDVVSAREIRALGLPDYEQLAIATQDQRAILTSNVADFRRLAIESASASVEHYGVVLVYGQFRREQLGVALHKVARFLDEHSAEDLHNTTFALSAGGVEAK